MLAELGYVALAVDMYGDGKTVDNPKEAGALSGEAMKNFDVSDERFRAARDLLARQSDVDVEPGSLPSATASAAEWRWRWRAGATT